MVVVYKDSLVSILTGRSNIAPSFQIKHVFSYFDSCLDIFNSIIFLLCSETEEVDYIKWELIAGVFLRHMNTSNLLIVTGRRTHINTCSVFSHCTHIKTYMCLVTADISTHAMCCCYC